MSERESMSYMEFAERIKNNYIPIKNNHVSRDFISFVLNSTNKEFSDYFETTEADGVVSEEEFNQIRRNATSVIIGVITDINKDFTSQKIYKNNTFLILENIIKSFGFHKIFEINHQLTEDFESLDELMTYVNVQPLYCEIEETETGIDAHFKEKEFYYFNYDTGFLWNIKTHGHYFVEKSILYGNIRKNKTNKKDENLLKIEFNELARTNVEGFSIDMMELPSYKMEVIYDKYEPQPYWLTLPSFDFANESLIVNDFKYLPNQATNQMLAICIERFNTENEYFDTLNISEVYKSFKNKKNLKLETDIFLVEYLLDGYTNPELFYRLFEKEKDEYKIEEVSIIIDQIFKNDIISLRDINRKHIIDFLTDLKEEELIKIKEKKNDLINVFKVEPMIFNSIDQIIKNKFTN